MKRSTIFAFCILLFMSACKTTKHTAATIGDASYALTSTKWKLIELNGKPVADKINGKEPFLEFLEAGRRYSASGGCNGLGGEFAQQGNGKIKFSQGMSTMMACENMEVETQLKQALIAADNYSINGDTLSLNKARMAPLARFKAIEPAVTNSNLNGTWELDYISGPGIAFDGLYPNKKPIISFNLTDNKLTGNSSCNNFNTTFIIDGNNIRFNEPAATRMACAGDGEAVFFKTLATVNKYSVNGNTLNLIMGDIAVMRFQKK